ncbi:hypothetical protein HanRHA438_Chr11g0505211 [Helianthus annuus]|nr:hypothetical protein HanHA300_Chr11g0403711 [Helianthus annuus]KAJ0509567.1 hypothetical protein HanIR_Chr11g0530361 [Helianthus annuus]KAJ0517602.1 hypothetical protein HanHA89_Chr11g0427301 [Helianthus annuus]KAJ0685616.1 hypothetical protein HanLR1_Chr11g0404781 [Helianthus annuus]KAJ0689502.1 hypothetical protein HanOQP8_Chr11g0406521 [Helianthus annuus]
MRNCIRWYQSFGFQMARREGEYLFARRVADRGNDMSVFYSRACGEDRHPTRRVADRGSDGLYLDPRDLKIKRLRQRVRDLEEIKRLRQRVRDLEEIKRLRQRVRDLELQREMRVKETESGTVIRDDVNEEEEYPFGHPHPRFYEPIYQESLTDDEPDSSNIVWDESDDEEESADEEVKTLVAKNRLIHVADDDSDGDSWDEQAEIEEDFTCNVHAYRSCGETWVLARMLASQQVGQCTMYNEVSLRSTTSIEVEDGSPVVHAIPATGNWTFDDRLETPFFTPVCATIFNIEPNNLQFKIQMKDIDFCDNWPIYLSSVLDNTENKDGVDSMHINRPRHGMDANLKNVEASIQMDIYCGPQEHVKIVGEPCKISLEVGLLANGNNTNTLGDCVPFICNNNRQNMADSNKLAIVKRWSNIILNPGGTNPELGETTREVKLCRRVVMIINNVNHVDVLLNPGGYFYNDKTRGRVFFEDGENDAGEPVLEWDPG